jgi:hypothetical protein
LERAPVTKNQRRSASNLRRPTITRQSVLVYLFVAALWVSAGIAARAEDGKEVAAAKLSQAQAHVKAGRCAEALPLFDAVLAVAGEDRTVLTEAANCGRDAKQARRALGYAQRALAGADEAWKSSERGQAVLRLVPELEKIVQRQDSARKRMPELLHKSIQNLHKHGEIVTATLFQPKAGHNGKYEMKDPDTWFDDGFFCVATIHEPERRVSFSLWEWYEEGNLAQARFDSIVKTIRARKEAWQRSHRDASKEHKFTLHEVLDAEGPRAAPNRNTTFCWDEKHCLGSRIAMVDLVAPSTPEPDRAHLPQRWLVMTALESGTLRSP